MAPNCNLPGYDPIQCIPLNQTNISLNQNKMLISLLCSTWKCNLRVIRMWYIADAKKLNFRFLLKKSAPIYVSSLFLVCLLPWILYLTIRFKNVSQQWTLFWEAHIKLVGMLSLSKQPSFCSEQPPTLFSVQAKNHMFSITMIPKSWWELPRMQLVAV